MRRREFIKASIASAAAWPLAARAQQGERIRRIAVLMNLAEDDAEGRNRIGVFLQALQHSGWTDGHNARIDTRWGVGNPDLYRRYAVELIALAPDVILTSGGSAVSALQRATRTVPIVFVTVTDPVGGGLVESLARPGGNTTGFTQFEYGMSAKWLELLKQVAPSVTRVGVLRAAAFPTGIGQFAAIQAVASSFGVELRPIDARDAGEIESAVTAFAHGTNGGLIVTSNPLMTLHREPIIALAARLRLPAVYSSSHFVTKGGLASYGPSALDQFRRAAGYVDRILKGEKPADLPVQAPSKYDTVINLKTAKALGLTVPPSVLARADEVIE